MFSKRATISRRYFPADYPELLSDLELLSDPELAAMAGMLHDLHAYKSGSYDDQVLGFASGKYAFVSQGSWIGASMTTTYADQYAAAGNFEVGMIPYAFIEGQDTIQTNSPNWWGLYKDGNVDAAKAFIQWCSQNDGGQQILAEKCGCVSPFVSSQYAPADPYAKTIADYTAAGKTSAWHWQGWKAGLAQKDKVHFTRAGYRLVGDMLYEALYNEIARQPQLPLSSTPKSSKR